ncbi:MAG TPA: MAPEG family protein [Steroidobacteraceae bacterium]|nr:MAPEG family protein [Steroidobacteraceae bacterium]
MQWVHLVIGLALVEFFCFGFAVGAARGRYKIEAPATAGHPVFERYFRVHMNTLEQLLIFIPAALIFGMYLSPYVAAGLGVLFIVGRLVYFRSYVKDPAKRSAGFALSAIPNIILMLGAIFGAARAALLLHG